MPWEERASSMDAISHGADQNEGVCLESIESLEAVKIYP